MSRLGSLRPAAAIDDRVSAWGALAQARRDARTAMTLPLAKALPRVATVLEELRRLRKEQPFEWAYPQDARRWFETLCAYIQRAEDLLEELTERSGQ